jgi:hypothetical protein
MTSYGTTPVGDDSVPLSSAWVPGGVNPVPVGGSAGYTDGARTYTHAAINDIEPSGYIALTSPAATTTANTDTPYTFSSQVNHVILQNNTSALLHFAFDVAATNGSLVLQPGAFLIYAKRVTVVHLLTVAAQNVNGSAAGNIVLLGVN